MSQLSTWCSDCGYGHPPEYAPCIRRHSPTTPKPPEPIEASEGYRQAINDVLWYVAAVEMTLDYETWRKTWMPLTHLLQAVRRGDTSLAIYRPR